MKTLKKIFGLEGKRTRWVIIEEQDAELTQLFLGIQPLNQHIKHQNLMMMKRDLFLKSHGNL